MVQVKAVCELVPLKPAVEDVEVVGGGLVLSCSLCFVAPALPLLSLLQALVSACMQEYDETWSECPDASYDKRLRAKIPLTKLVLFKINK